jgi:protein-disulfide isomerase
MLERNATLRLDSEATGVLVRVFMGLLFYLMILGLPNGAWAQERNKKKSMQEEISALKQDVKDLEEKQQKISEQLDELKKILKTNSGTRQNIQVPETVALRGEPVKGDSAARVAVIEYADFECPFCGQYMRQAYPQIVDNYIKTGKIKYFYRDLPLSMHSHAMVAAQAALCAGDQGKFWEMHDSLFANQGALTENDMANRAKSLGMDSGELTQCVSSEKYSKEIEKSATEAQSMGIDGTPTFFLGVIQENGKVVKVEKTIVGAHSYKTFKSDLDELLASQ